MSVGYTALALLLTSVVARAEIPAGYIMQVTPNCGANDKADASVTIVTDLNAKAKAVCLGGKEVAFTSTDGVNFNLPFSYPGQGRKPCTFTKRTKSRVYAVKVIVSYGEPSSLVHQYTEEYTVTCTFSPKGSDSSKNQKIADTLIAAKEIQTNVGSTSRSAIHLKMVDVLGHNLNGRSVDLGRTVQLKAVNTGSEAGIRPISCDAIDGSSARYAILRAGCGDGIVFPKNIGFTTIGKKTQSPYFEAFTVNVNSALKFECNFTMCASRCDGNSCTNAGIGKRDVSGMSAHRGYAVVATDAVAIVNTAPGEGGMGDVHVDRSQQ
uniref:Vitelline envelope zona pellucida domain 10 n=1 Tax=Haliotis discus hannai TaxID=42344 RepID=A0MCR1_HALDH|nr:vitelline envelope zona pellucida domain 10 [Haliotis discus hannai]